MARAEESVFSEPLGLRTASQTIRQAISPYGLSLLLSLLYLFSAQILAVSRGEPVSASVIGYIKQLGVLVPLLIAIWATGQIFVMLTVEKPAKPLQAFCSRLATMLLDARRWSNAIPFLASIQLMSTAYAYFKSTIPYLRPFDWDQTFDRLDLWLHGGVRPWEWLQPILGHPLISFAINFSYNIWFFVMIGVWLWLAFTLNKRAARHQFLLSYLLTWMFGGSVLAIIFSSAGPCYYGNLLSGPDPYTGLLAYLRSVDENSYPIWALETQAMLWRGYLDPVGNLSGISAMPSMHAATATLFIPLAFRMDSRAGWLAIGFWLLIMLGSVHLGWHYAVDSYAGVALAAGFWWLAGILVGDRDMVPAQGTRAS